MGKTIGAITQEGEEMPFRYSVFKKGWESGTFASTEVGAVELDGHYILQRRNANPNFNLAPISFGVVCNMDKEEADRRLYERALSDANECDEVEDNTHYSSK